MENSMYTVHNYNILNDVEYPSETIKSYLRKSMQLRKPQPLSVEELLFNSAEMDIKFPNEIHRIKNQSPHSYKLIEEEASSTYPVILSKVLVLYCNFLEHKLKYGTEIEKSIYYGMTIEGFVNRLLVKRCVSFFGKKDRFLLRSGDIGNGGFEFIGTSQEKSPLVMRDYLTFDEIKLSTFITISSCCKNKVTIGICGPQLDKKRLLDYQDIILGKSQNCVGNGYGKRPKQNICDEMDELFHKRSMWDKFYNHKSPLYGRIYKKEAINSRRGFKTLERYKKIDQTTDICDCYMLEKRYSAMIMQLLVESNSRAKKLGKIAYVWINKNRLGLEKMTKWQEEYFLRIFVTTAICLYRGLYSIYCIHFENFYDNCWVKDNTFLNNNNECDPYFWNKHPHQGIKIRLSSMTVEKRGIQADDKYIYVSTYTANANSLPGNEYWMKKISSNKDSTTFLASHSFISELHNTFVNRTMVSGDNLHVATENGVHHISDYCCRVLENNIF